MQAGGSSPPQHYADCLNYPQPGCPYASTYAHIHTRAPRYSHVCAFIRARSTYVRIGLVCLLARFTTAYVVAWPSCVRICGSPEGWYVKVQSGIVPLAERFTRRKLKTEARDCERRRREGGRNRDQFSRFLLGERTTVLREHHWREDPRHVFFQ